MKFLVGAILGVIALIGIKEAPVQAAAVSWEAPEWTDYHTAEFRWSIPSDASNYDHIQIKIFKDGSEYWGSGNVPLMYSPGESYSEETEKKEDETKAEESEAKTEDTDSKDASDDTDAHASQRP